MGYIVEESQDGRWTFNHHGMPVPYVADWHTETQDRIAIGYDPFIGMPAVYFADTPGGAIEGDNGPVFGRMNPSRQRECMVRQLCQVCHLPNAPWLVLNRSSLQRITVKGRSMLGLIEPWVCEVCLPVAMTLCPHLGTEQVVTPVMPEPGLFGMAISQAAFDGFPETWDTPVAMWVRLLLDESYVAHHLAADNRVGTTLEVAGQ